jgi:hypothetical protein
MIGRQNGGGPQNISSRVKFNNENSLLYRIISGAIKTNHSLAFMRGTGFLTRKMTAIWPEKKHDFPLHCNLKNKTREHETICSKLQTS